jgi:hypothetical protein
MELIRQTFRRQRWAALALGLALALSACSLDKVDVPELDGPSELGLSLYITATPDVLTADGNSTSVVEVTVRDQNGATAAGRAVIFSVANEDGLAADLGTVENPLGNPVRATEAQATTDGNGVARVIYRSPARTDLSADTNVQIKVRPIGTDFNGAVDRFVRIELKSAVPRLFPSQPGDLKCDFVVQAPGNRAECSDAKTCRVLVNTDVLFQSVSTGTIVRYQWFWGDGSPTNDSPDTNHVWRLEGTFQVVHVVTNNLGATESCTADLTIVSSLN